MSWSRPKTRVTIGRAPSSAMRIVQAGRSSCAPGWILRGKALPANKESDVGAGSELTFEAETPAQADPEMTLEAETPAQAVPEMSWEAET